MTRKFEELLAAGVTFDVNLTSRSERGPTKSLGRRLDKEATKKLVQKYRAKPGFQIVALDTDGFCVDVGTNFNFPPTALERAIGGAVPAPFGHTE